MLHGPGKANVEHPETSAASDMLEHTQSYLEKCDILPTLCGFEVNETFLQTVVTVLGTAIATGASCVLA